MIIQSNFKTETQWWDKPANPWYRRKYCLIHEKYRNGCGCILCKNCLYQDSRECDIL